MNDLKSQPVDSVQSDIFEQGEKANTRRQTHEEQTHEDAKTQYSECLLSDRLFPPDSRLDWHFLGLLLVEASSRTSGRCAD